MYYIFLKSFSLSIGLIKVTQSLYLKKLNIDFLIFKLSSLFLVSPYVLTGKSLKLDSKYIFELTLLFFKSLMSNTKSLIIHKNLGAY